jgi:hypothetical protein
MFDSTRVDSNFNVQQWGGTVHELVFCQLDSVTSSSAPMSQLNTILHYQWSLSLFEDIPLIIKCVS